MIQRAMRLSLAAVLLLLALGCTAEEPQVELKFAPQAAEAAPAQTVDEGAAGAVPAEAQPESGEAELVARVNGVPIPRSDFEQRLQQFEQVQLAAVADQSGEEANLRRLQLQEQVLEGLVDEIIIAQAAERMGISVSEAELEAYIAEMRQGQNDTEFNAWLEMNGFSRDDFRETLEAQLVANALFEEIAMHAPQAVEQVSVRHILLKDLESANAALSRLQTGEDFVSLAVALSTDTETQALGGDLGWLPRGTRQVPPQVEQAAFSLEIGQVSPIIESVMGYHILLVEGREAERALTPEQLQVVQSNMFQEWLSQQRASATIERYLN